MRRLRAPDDRRIPDHPYRDSAIIYGVMALLLVGVTALTGGSLPRALVAAALFFMLATAWSWWKFRERIRGREAALAATQLAPGGTADVEVAGRDAVDPSTNGRGRVEQ